MQSEKLENIPVVSTYIISVVEYGQPYFSSTVNTGDNFRILTPIFTCC